MMLWDLLSLLSGTRVCVVDDTQTNWAVESHSPQQRDAPLTTEERIINSDYEGYLALYNRWVKRAITHTCRGSKSYGLSWWKREGQPDVSINLLCSLGSLVENSFYSYASSKNKVEKRRLDLIEKITHPSPSDRTEVDRIITEHKALKFDGRVFTDEDEWVEEHRHWKRHQRKRKG